MKEIVAECKPFKKSHVCRMDDFLEDAEEIVKENSNKAFRRLFERIGVIK